MIHLPITRPFHHSHANEQIPFFNETGKLQKEEVYKKYLCYCKNSLSANFRKEDGIYISQISDIDMEQIHILQN